MIVSTVKRLCLGCSVGEETSVPPFSLNCPGPDLRPYCSETKGFTLSLLPWSVQEAGIRDLPNYANNVSMGFCFPSIWKDLASSLAGTTGMAAGLDLTSLISRECRQSWHTGLHQLNYTEVP